MPRGSKILGKPIDEDKWARAKKRAEVEGQSGNYAYIVSIYKKMMHLSKSAEKSSIDNQGQSGYSENRGMRLVLAKGADGLDEFRCGVCEALLFRGFHLEKSFIEVKCRSCGTFNLNRD